MMKMTGMTYCFLLISLISVLTAGYMATHNIGQYGWFFLVSVIFAAAARDTVVEQPPKDD